MMMDFGQTVEQISDKSGFSQSTIRRRIKLLELNRDSFKKAEKRGATLSDFAQLDKIEDLEARNRVLETLGTANFNREMQNALSDQKYQHRKAEWIEQLRQFAVENPDANYSTHAHVAGYGYWNTSKDVEVPDDADSVAYCYKVSQNQIDLYKERDLGKENAETAKREEKRQQEQFYKDQLSALTNYIVDGKKAAWEVVGYVDDYLRTNVGLQLNDKTAVIPLGKPVEFVGRKITPDKIELRRQTSLGMKKHLRYVREAYGRGEVPLEYALSVIQSYLGLMQDCNNDALRNQILEDYVLVRHSDMLDAAE